MTSDMRIGSLCSGYGGLDMAAEALTGGLTAWVSDIDKGARKILEHRYPGVPNLGDFTATDWSTVEPIDVLTAGYPCQPFSHAGNRAGANDARHLWPEVLRCLTSLRPRFALFENVRGHLSLGFDQVLADLATHDYDARWIVLRAADIGAPHGRARLFILAADARRGRDRWDLVGAGRGAVRAGGVRGEGPAGRSDAGRAGLRSDDVTLLPTPDASAHKYRVGGDSQQSKSLAAMARREEILLPTPAVNDMGAAYTPDQWDAWTDRMKAEHGNGNGHGKSLNIEAQRLRSDPVAEPANWGQYAAAIHRWEQVIGRPAPAPTMLGRERRVGHCERCRRSEGAHRRARSACDGFTWTITPGPPQLAPRFAEWMMGLPEGWVDDVPDLTRAEKLKALGNGVVAQQAVEAVDRLLTIGVPA